MFYECKNCKRRWEYPLAACPFDFAKPEPMESKTAKVVNVSKVSISTLFHPTAPYYILLLEDEFGNVFGYKSDKEFKLGEEFNMATSADANAVAIWRVKYDVSDAIEKAIGLIGGISVGMNSNVVVLPTLAAASHEYFRDNTSPRFLDAVLALLINRGVKPENIIIGSQSFDEVPITAMAQKSGLLGLSAKYKITPVDFATAEYEKADPPAGEARPQGGQLEIVKAVREADLVVNLAMEKIGQAAATQNMFSVLKKENYLGLKYLSSDQDIAKLLEPLLNKMVVIGEAEYVQRSYKLTTFMGLVLAGRKALNVDRVFNEAAMAFKLPEIASDIAMEAIPVVGRSIKEVQYRAEIF